MSKGGCLTYGDGRDIHSQEFLTDRVSFVPQYLSRVSYLRSSAKLGSLGFRKPDTFQDSQKIPLKVQRHARKCGTSDSDEGHAAGLICSSSGQCFGNMWAADFVWCFSNLGAEVNGFVEPLRVCGNPRMDRLSKGPRRRIQPSFS